MADVIDDANNQAQLILDKQIELVRMNVVNPYQNESGICWGCDAPVPDGRRWCSKECAEASEL